jgi:hypothetical protein
MCVRMFLADDADDLTEELLQSVGAVKVLDKLELANELVPAILELAPAETTPR